MYRLIIVALAAVLLLGGCAEDRYQLVMDTNHVSHIYVDVKHCTSLPNGRWLCNGVEFVAPATPAKAGK